MRAFQKLKNYGSKTSLFNKTTQLSMLIWHTEGISRKNKIITLDWPAPDLNPIENASAIIENKIFARASEITEADYND
jgi:hypothetical protein